MARRSSKVRTSMKSRRPRADWVYRQHAIRQDTGAQVDSLGTYDDGIVVQATGIANAQSHILYDSHDQLATTTASGVEVPAGTPQRLISRAARAEGRKATVLATQGVILLSISNWVLGNVLAYGWRLGAFEQDRTGVFSLDAQYSMWVTAGATPFEPVAQWANFRRLNAKEGRFFRSFNADQLNPLFVVPIFWRGRRTLDPRDCWGIFTELEGTSVNVSQQFWLRSLVVDEG